MRKTEIYKEQKEQISFRLVDVLNFMPKCTVLTNRMTASASVGQTLATCFYTQQTWCLPAWTKKKVKNSDKIV